MHGSTEGSAPSRRLATIGHLSWQAIRPDIANYGRSEPHLKSSPPKQPNRGAVSDFTPNQNACEEGSWERGRGCVLPKEGGRYLLQVDRQTKGSYKTSEAAQSAALAIKTGYPVVKVSIYDSVN